MQQFRRRTRPWGQEGALNEALSFDDFVRARADALMRYAYVLTGDPHDAADLLQESLTRVRAAWPRVIDKREPEGYARTTMARLHITLWRRRRRERLMAVPPERAYTDERFGRADGDDGLWDALGALPRKQRAVLVLRYYESLSDAEIAEVLGISRGTVRSQASRALEKLRGSWRPSVLKGSAR
jgi:RNA polymerase sigma-70 factor (sigma-E family)